MFYNFKRKCVFVFTALLAVFSIQAQNTEIQVLSAVIKNKVIDGAQVIFQKNGEPSVPATTDAQGKINISTPFGTDNGDVTMIIKKEGYSPLIAKGPFNGLTYALSPVMNQLDGLRIVLNWGSTPNDLDSHLSYPGSHIYFESKVGSNANLDVDDVDSYGPETITIETKEQGKKYLYAVHNFTDKEAANGTRLSSISQAKVFVYIGNTLIRRYTVPAGQTGNTWIVFMIDENGAFVDINRFSSANSSQAVRGLLERFRNSNDPINETIPSQQQLTTAKDINKMGETAYHAGKIEESITYYQQAIDLYPNFAQAYSNLGLSFMKLGKEAETIWANRKAIALATGTTKNTVQASSYYNIAKMYEKKEQWEQALQNYTWAKEKKIHPAYDSGIQRMNQKLGR